MQEPVEPTVIDIEAELQNDSCLDILALCSSLISVSLIASLIVAQRGWVLQQRAYPRLPVLDSLSIANPLEPIFYTAMLLSLLAFNFSGRKKMLAAVFGLATAATIALDQTRLQPWLYLLSIMLLLIASAKSLSVSSSRSVLNSLRICIVGTYLFAGIQKLNISFCQIVIPSMFPKFMPPLPAELCMAIGIPAALVEASLAVLLILPATRTFGAWLAILFHTITLWMISYQGWNAVVWPWNISMMLLVFLLFIRSKPESLSNFCRPDSLQKILAIIIFLLLPILNFFGMWPNYLSAALYSGNTPVLRAIVAREDEERLPHAIRQAIDISDKNGPTLIAERWGIEELGIPSFPEVTSLEQLAAKLVASGKFSNSEIYIDTFPRFFNGEKRRRAVFLSAAKSH